MAAIKPIELKGNWIKGYALDIHTISSEYLGDNELGHSIFKTERSPLGELLFRLKYRSDKSVLDEILNTVVDFLNNKWQITNCIDLIIPVPPSDLDRDSQPVIEIANNLSSKLKIKIDTDSLIKLKETPELKNIEIFEERIELLEDVFSIKDLSIERGKILLFDDLYRSGATLQVITKALYEKGKADNVYVLTLTKTRSRL